MLKPRFRGIRSLSPAPRSSGPPLFATAGPTTPKATCGTKPVCPLRLSAPTIGLRLPRRSNSAALTSQRVIGEYPITNGAVINEMVLDKLRNAIRGHAVVPDAFRIDHHGRSMTTDPKAADFCPITGLFTAGQSFVFD